MMANEIKPEFVFKGYSEGKHYKCVDFLQNKFIDCDYISVSELYGLTQRPDTVKFFRVEADT